MSSLKIAIENLYRTFGRYTTEGMHHCDCGCINSEDVKKLQARPLSALEEDDLVSYHGSALYTWGDVEHYKHYLPRILELRSEKRSYAFVGLDEVFNKLDYANWQEWDDNEIQAIKDYVMADWIEFANQEESEISDRQLEAYNKFFPLKDILKVWDIRNSPNALRNFVSFFYYHGNQYLNGGRKANETKQNIELNLLIQSDKLIDRLETEFFKYEQSDMEYAEKVSVVLQMIGQQLKAMR